MAAAFGASALVGLGLATSSSPRASAAEDVSLAVSAAGSASAVEIATITLPMVGTEPLKAWVARAAGSLDDPRSQSEAFGSVLFPTDVVAAPQGIFNLLGFPVVGDVLPPEHPVVAAYGALPALIPPWPLAASASHPGQSGGRRNILRSLTAQVPGTVPVAFDGLVQAADAGAAFAASSAESSVVTFSFPAGLGVGELSGVVGQALGALPPFAESPDLAAFLAKAEGVTSRYRTAKDGASATSEALTEIGRLQILGGLLTVTGMEAVARHAVGPTGPISVEHAYRVAGTAILGIPVQLGDEGLHVADRRLSPDQAAAAEDALRRVLDSLPIRLVLPRERRNGDQVDTTVLSVEVPGSDVRLSFGVVSSRLAARRTAGGVTQAVTADAPPDAPAAPALGAAPAASGRVRDVPGPGASDEAGGPLAATGGDDTATRPAPAPGDMVAGRLGNQQLVSTASALESLMHRVAALMAAGAVAAVLSWRARRGVLLALRDRSPGGGP